MVELQASGASDSKHTELACSSVVPARLVLHYCFSAVAESRSGVGILDHRLWPSLRALLASLLCALCVCVCVSFSFVCLADPKLSPSPL